jgi:chaperonin cofactor prefoldin
MTASRRRVIRPPSPVPTVTSVRLPRLRSQLEREQQSLTNWTAKLKRAFHSFEKITLRIARLQRQIRQLEQT